MSMVPVGGAPRPRASRGAILHVTPAGTRSHSTARSLTPRVASMAVNRITAAINKLTFPPSSQVLAYGGTPMLVCSATLNEWNAYVQNEDEAVSAKLMAWFGPDTATGDTLGDIHIIEYPTSRPHERFISALNRTIQADAAAMHYLEDAGTSTNTTGRQYKPDASYSPRQSVMQPLGVGLPAVVVDWDSYMTIKIEIGVSQGWGDRNGTLDWKATQWATIAGVVYVLCIHVDNDLLNASYKLYEVIAPRTLSPYPADAIPIVAPATIVQMDSRLVLGLQPVDPLPVGFPDPFQIDVFDVLQSAHARR